MDYDSYEVYERNSPDAREEAEYVRERGRKLDRERREQEEELQWERDRSQERHLRSNVREAFFDDGDGYRKNNRQYDDADNYEKDGYWESGSAGTTFDYNHGMFGSMAHAPNKERAEFGRLEGGTRNYESSTLSGNRAPRRSIQCDIKEDPTSTIFLGGISRTLDERDLEKELVRCGLHAKDIRIIRQKETGANRGFAFVDFHSVADAQRWMELNQGRLFLRNRFTISMDYSRSGATGAGTNGASSSDSRYDAISKNDWKCFKCGCDNFRRRLRCFKCGISKEESEQEKPREAEESRNRQGHNMPLCTVVVRGLDGLTSESGVVQVLTNITNCRIRNVFVVRNEKTGIGQGYGYVEFYSRQEAEEVVETIHSMDSPLEIEGKGIWVDYSKESFASVVAPFNKSLMNSNPTVGYDYDGIQGPQYSSYYAESADVSETYDHIPTTAHTEQSLTGPTLEISTSTSDASSSSAAAAAGIAELGTSGGSLSTLDSEFANYAPPDLNRYVFDDLTGYYIDPMTGLYYDAGTQYFYHMETGNFLYWDPEKKCYVLTPVQDQGTKNSETEITASPTLETPSKPDDEKQKRAKEAKKIAKEMEKWAKEQNSHKDKDSSFKKPLAPISLPPKAKQSAAADAGFSVLTKSKFTIELSKQKEDKKIVPVPALPGLVEYGGDSDSETELDEQDEEAAALDAEKALEEKLIDRGKRTCLLCRRAFSSVDILEKHQQLSDLHKKNLDEYKKKLTGTVTRAAVTGIPKAMNIKR